MRAAGELDEFDDDELGGPGEAGEPGPGPVAAISGWIAVNPETRGPALCVPALFTAAEVMNLEGTSWYYPVAGTALAAVIASYTAARRARARLRLAEAERSDPQPGFRPAEVSAAVCAAGGWVTAASTWGPLGSHADWLGLALAAGTLGGRRWLKRHKAMLARRSRIAAEELWIQRKAWWHQYSWDIDLGGTHLLNYVDTLLGVAVVIDTRPIARASQINTDHVAELIAERENLPTGRVNVFVNRQEQAGRLHVHIRRADPWKHPFYHPATHPDSPFAPLVPYPATCRRPLVIGVDPETGDPLTITPWDPDEGGKVILVVASKGSGKTVLLNCLTERLTACDDALVIQINFSKHREDLQWSPACALSCLGWERVAHARRALQWVLDEITERSRQIGGVSKIVPSRATPLIVVKIDEIDEVRRDPVCRDLIDRIAGKCRSEAVAIVGVSQTARADMIGSVFRAQADVLVAGRFRKQAEAKRALDGLRVPDMSEYGGNKPGVHAVIDMGAGGSHRMGRTFKLEAPPEIGRIVARRAGRVRQPVQRSAGQTALWAQASGVAVLEPIWPDESLDDAGGGPDESLDDAGGGLKVACPAGPGPDPAGPAASRPAPAGGDSRSVGELRDRIAGVIDSAADPQLPDLSDEARARMAAASADRHRAYLAELANVDIPPDMAAALLTLLCQPDGVSSRQAAGALLGSENGRMTTFRWLHKFQAQGLAEVRGKGPRRRFYATDKGRQALARAAGGDT